MNPTKVQRDKVTALTDLPNIGPSMAEDLRLLGIESPKQLKGQDPYEMYDRLCVMTSTHQDPCVLDVFLSVTRFMNGESPKTWWSYTAERKRVLQERELEPSRKSG